jgi:hypothetical protein
LYKPERSLDVIEQEKTELSYCRRCGGDRHHTVIAEKHRNSHEEETGVQSGDTWSILECRGCESVSFVHAHWFSEDYEIGDNGPEPVVYRDLYPPSPRRSMPEWAALDLCLSLPRDLLSVRKLHTDIYTALGTGAFSLAAMGTRAIMDMVLTSKVGDVGGFAKKLKLMRENGSITEVQKGVLVAVFAAGSAAAHRGHSPTREDVYTMLDITETMLRQLYIDPMRQKLQEEAAATLKTRTPQRSQSKPN